MTTFSMAYMVHMCNGITIASYCRRDTQEVAQHAETLWQVARGERQRDRWPKR